MLLVVKVKSSGSTIPEGTILQLEVDPTTLPQATGAGASATDSDRLDMAAMVERYEVDARTIRRWVRANRVPFFKIGGKLFFHKSDLDAKERECKVMARGAAPSAIKLRAERALARPAIERSKA